VGNSFKFDIEAEYLLSLLDNLFHGTITCESDACKDTKFVIGIRNRVKVTGTLK